MYIYTYIYARNNDTYIDIYDKYIKKPLPFCEILTDAYFGRRFDKFVSRKQGDVE